MSTRKEPKAVGASSLRVRLEGLQVFRVVEAARKRGDVRVWTVEYDDVEDEARVIWAEDDQERARIICNLMNLAFDTGWAARSESAEEGAI